MTHGHGGYHVHIGGDVSGQVSVGDNNVQVRSSEPVTEQDLARLRTELAELRALVPAAAQKIDELDEALTGGEVDLPTVEHVQGWFRRRLPQFLGALNKVVLGPVVAKLVAAGGEQLAAEFTRRLG
ncbi:hypothetical protein GCM10010174_76830 [Kutzneria viridogrisea]|uniref:Uncharacterized protein n=2 Tax=Kutzneria TaxID=43356 RepID=W5W6C8_9PSEU|nr:hypothetical protein [Kutzneria albida]AHH96315.1 hypothetical protein KALB_2947 [Kutzneria albida DSM 43870]MBA8928470.1 hypothetical protein [Kutzneria viridogrisea]